MTKRPETRRRHINLVVCITVLSVLCLMGGAKFFYTPSPTQPANMGALQESSRRNSNLWNKHAVDSAINMLQTGDLVLRNGIDVTSDMLRQMNQTDKTYSHCGLVVIEHGYPFIYHSIGGEDNPNARLRRDSASLFFSPSTNLRFGLARYNVNNTVREEIKKTVWNYYKQRVLFDMDFDLKTDNKLYCAEFVYKTMNKATADEHFLLPTKLLGYTFVGTDNLFINPHAQMIWQVQFK